MTQFVTTQHVQHPQHDPHPDHEHGAPHGAADGAAERAVGRGSAGGAPSAPCFPPKVGKHGGRRPHSPPAVPSAHGAAHGAPHGAVAWTPEAVEARMAEAGRTLMTLPDRGHSTRLRTSSLDIVRTALDSYGWQGGRIRLPLPDAASITRMDAALGWLALIPDDRYVLRRIVGARSLSDPLTGRALFPWRRLGMVLGADHKAVQRWHAQGLALIAAGLNA